MNATSAVDNWADGTQTFIDKMARTIDVFVEVLDKKLGTSMWMPNVVGTVSVTGRAYAVVRVYDDSDVLLCSSLVSLPAALRLVELADWDERYKKIGSHGTETGRPRQQVDGFRLTVRPEARVGVADTDWYQTIWSVDATELGNVFRHFLTED